MWLWPPIMQKELDKFVHFANNRRMRKQKDKVLPSGVTPDFAYTFPDQFGGRDCLIPVDRQVVKEILDDMEAEKDALTDWGVPPEFAAAASAAAISLEINIEECSLNNIWWIFAAIIQ